MRPLSLVPLAVALLACSDTPPATRHFAVGVTTRDLADLSRSTPANGTAPAHAGRTLRTEIWYPSSLPVSASTLDETTDAPPARGPFPLAVFVHGSEGGRRQSTFLTQALAADGWIVAAADFPLTAATTPGGPSDLHADDQVGDARFLADTLFTLPASDALAGAADAAKGYALVGHSTGGTVALLAAEAPDMHDDRLRAAVALAPCACFFGDAFFTTRALPLAIVVGTDDLFVPPSDNGVRAYALAGPPKLLAKLVGGNHLYFTDYPIDDKSLHPDPTTNDADLAQTLARYGGGSCSPVPPPGTDPPLSFDAQHAATALLVPGFLDETMRGEARVAAPASVELERAP